MQIVSSPLRGLVCIFLKKFSKPGANFENRSGYGVLMWLGTLCTTE